MNVNPNKDRRTRRKSSIDLSTMVYGKLPPQARELEEAILGACMLELDAFSTVREMLMAKCFYVDAHQRIFSAFESLRRQGIPIDTLTVVQELKCSEQLDEIGGPYYILKLTNAVVSTANIEAHCMIVYQKFIQRELIRISGEIIGDAYEDSTDVFELLDKSLLQIEEINIGIEEKRVIDIPNLAVSIIQKFETKVINARNNIVDPNDIYLGFKQWDKINGPMFPGLHIWAARPGMGKTALVVQALINITHPLCSQVPKGQNKKAGFINGEMTNEQALMRCGCNLREMNNEIWKKDKIDITDEEMYLVKEAMEAVLAMNLYLDDTKDLDRIVSKIIFWVKKQGVRIVFIDFLQMISIAEEVTKYMTETQVINYILGILAGLAKRLKIPIVLLSQLNRENLKRVAKEPHLGDLKGSGKIEELAYQVAFIHRPEYYEETGMFDEMGESTKGLTYIIIAKHRDGQLDKIKLKSALQISSFKDWDDYDSMAWKPLIISKGMTMTDHEDDALPF